MMRFLRVCATRLREGSAEFEAHERDALHRFHERVRAISEPIRAAFLREPVEHWEQAILAHRSHRHAWYDSLANEVSVREYAAFFLENGAFPSFQKLVERVELAQITDQGRAAVRRNIEDERHPVPHSDLMRRLIVALENKAGAGLVLESYPSLVDRTLVFHYGYYCDPWHSWQSFCHGSDGAIPHDANETRSRSPRLPSGRNRIRSHSPSLR